MATQPMTDEQKKMVATLATECEENPSSRPVGMALRACLARVEEAEKEHSADVIRLVREITRMRQRAEQATAERDETWGRLVAKLDAMEARCKQAEAEVARLHEEMATAHDYKWLREGLALRKRVQELEAELARMTIGAERAEGTVARYGDTIRLLRSTLANMVGASDRFDLEAMEAIIRQSEAPAVDKRVALDAIHALINTLPSDSPAPSQIDPGPSAD